VPRDRSVDIPLFLFTLGANPLRVSLEYLEEPVTGTPRSGFNTGFCGLRFVERSPPRGIRGHPDR
jgi:hypothetical protein